MKTIAALAFAAVYFAVTPLVSRAEDAPAFARWKEFSEKAKSMEGLLVYYTFEETDGAKKVVNRAAGTGIKGFKAKNSDAEIEGGAKVSRKQGRWSGKGSIYFDGESFLTAPDALFTQEMGKDKMPITVQYWCYVEEGDGGITGSIFSFGNDGNQRCSCHNPWQGNIYWDHGNIGTAGRISTSYADYYDKWHLVTLVSEGRGGAFKAIYFDGEEVISDGSSDGPEIDLEGLTVGTWAAAGTPQIAKMDEFMIFARVLTEKEIREFYKQGKP